MREMNTKRYKNLEYIKFWETFQCPYRAEDQYGNSVCTFYEDAIGECRPRNCPFLDEDMKEALESGEKLLNCIIRMEVVV